MAGSLALTFDDGPDPHETPAVLRALEEARVTATFFVLAAKVERYPELLGRVRAAGHDVQVHGYGHPIHTETSRDAVEADLKKALDVLADHGVTPRLWRPPEGRVAPYSQELAKRHGLTLAGWTHDTRDWQGRCTDEMLEDLTLQHGGIVLAHDGLGDERSLATARLIGPLVDRARAAGLEPGPLIYDGWPRPIPPGALNITGRPA